MKIEKIVITDIELIELVKEHLKKQELELSNPSAWDILECSDDCKEIIFGVG